MSTRAWKHSSSRWSVAPPFEGADELARQIATAPLVAQMLYNRGIADAEAAKLFMSPTLAGLHDPALLPGCEQAAKRIARAVADGEKIVIYGDYDVDGITAVAILKSVLRMVGAEAGFYVPHRLEEGYDVNVAAVRKLADEGAKLLVTVDCGISATGPLTEAANAGMDVIVTDHHRPGDKLPPAVAIVHPAVAGGYPNPDLSGAGVAFKLAWQIAREICGETRVDPAMRNFLLEATCLAALGTIADVVPLVGENRVLAAFGLRGLTATTNAGLRALLASADLTDGRVDAMHVGFILAPRLNACGRMGHAREAIELLTDASPSRAAEIAEFLAKQNSQRQRVDREIAAQAVEMVRASGLDADGNRAIVLSSPDWHSGVIGIVASRLVGQFSKPAILIALNGDGLGQGSGRSIPGFNLIDALSACAEHLISFGGHAMAGGLRIAQDKIDDFTKAMCDYANNHVTDRQLTPSLKLDAEVPLSALKHNTVEHLGRLAPFGQGNPRPSVAIRSCKIMIPPKRMGRNGRTVGMMLEQDGAKMRAVGFAMGDLADLLVGVDTIDVAAEPTLNTFNGRTNVELKLLDVRWD